MAGKQGLVLFAGGGAMLFFSGATSLGFYGFSRARRYQSSQDRYQSRHRALFREIKGQEGQTET